MEKEGKFKKKKYDYIVCVLLDGVPLEVIKHNGEDYISVEAGQKFSISVTNRTEHSARVQVKFNNFNVSSIDAGKSEIFSCMFLFLLVFFFVLF